MSVQNINSNQMRPADMLNAESKKLTNIVKGAAVKPDTNNMSAIEKQAAIPICYGSAQAAWDAAVAYNGSESNYPGKTFDNVGWVRGTKSANGEWGAYLWVIQNRIAFQASTSAWWTTNGISVAISNVMVGSLGDFQALENVDTNVPPLSMATNDFPGTDASESKEYRVDISNVYYRLSIPDIWITPRSAYGCAGGSNIQYSVAGSNIPNGVTWTLIPDLSGSGGATIQSNGAWQAAVIPGNVGTNYKVRATSTNNPNFYDQVSLTVLKMNIEQTETNVCWSATSVALNLTADSYLGNGTADWNSTPSGISGNGTNITFNPSSLAPTTYIVRAQSSLLTNCFDTCIVTVVKIEKIPLGGSTNLSKYIIGKVYIPTKWGGSNTLSGAHVQLFYTDGASLSMETAIQIAKGELDGNLVAQGNPCVYEIPPGDFKWYYVKITNESDRTISSTFYEHGEVARPWQGYYWSIDPDTNPNLYDDEYALDKYDQVYGTTAQVWEATNHVSTNTADGHCWGTAVASVLTNQPAETTSTNDVEFSQDDMEGLYIELANCGAEPYATYSVTNIPASPVSEALGEAVDDYCDEFHTVLSQVIIEKNKPLVGDLRDPDGQNENVIWNHAIYKYKSEMQQMPGQEDENIIRVKTWAWSPLTTTYPSTGSPPAQDRSDYYFYDIKYNIAGEIDGSYTNQNWRYASGFPPESLFWLKSSLWTAQNPEVSLERVECVYGD